MAQRPDIFHSIPHIEPNPVPTRPRPQQNRNPKGFQFGFPEKLAIGIAAIGLSVAARNVYTDFNQPDERYTEAITRVKDAMAEGTEVDALIIPAGTKVYDAVELDVHGKSKRAEVTTLKETTPVKHIIYYSPPKGGAPVYFGSCRILAGPNYPDRPCTIPAPQD